MAQTATVEIQMPEMGESVTEGIVLEWHVSEGDFVSEGDTVVEVSTDKVDAEVPAPTDGVITKLIASVDDEVPVGAPLAEMEPGDGSSEGSNGSAAGPVAEESTSSSQAAGDVPSSTPPVDGASEVEQPEDEAAEVSADDPETEQDQDEAPEALAEDAATGQDEAAEESEEEVEAEEEASGEGDSVVEEAEQA
jgi:2-oxoglutarate dehydrogenase E1 component